MSPISVIVVVGVVAWMVLPASGHSTGAPVEVCQDLTPRHPGGSTPNETGGFYLLGPFGYFLYEGESRESASGSSSTSNLIHGAYEPGSTYLCAYKKLWVQAIIVCVCLTTISSTIIYHRSRACRLFDWIQRFRCASCEFVWQRRKSHWKIPRQRFQSLPNSERVLRGKRVCNSKRRN